MIYKVTIPAPDEFISLNERLHWAPKARRTKAWRTAAKAYARAADLPKGLQRVRVEAFIIKPTNRKYDPHNLMPTLKAAIDGIVDYGLIPDDTADYLIGPDARCGGFGARGVVLIITDLSDEK